MRFAIYFAPQADHPLWAAGCEWLGRDAEAGTIKGGGADRDAPRRYGFHATLKPPFELREGLDAATLAAAQLAFAAAHRAFAMPALEVAMLGDFVALRPVESEATAPGTPLRELADDCVRHFDRFRRPASPDESARRLVPGLSDRQRGYLARWGYAYLLDDWRFHMTLSDSLPATAGGRATAARLRADAARHFAAALSQPMRCEGVALFVEPAPGADFRLIERTRFPA